MYIYMSVSVFICLHIPALGICVDIYSNGSLFFRVTPEVGRELVSPLLCLTKRIEIRLRELE